MPLVLNLRAFPRQVRFEIDFAKAVRIFWNMVCIAFRYVGSLLGSFEKESKEGPITFPLKRCCCSNPKGEGTATVALKALDGESSTTN